MKFVVLLAAFFATCTGSSLEILAAPASLKFPDSSATIKTTQISTLNENILGLSARKVEGFNVDVDLFSRPRALAVISVIGADKLDLGKTYTTKSDGVNTVGIDQDMALVFGSDRENVQVTVGGITGSQLALAAKQETVDSSIINTKRTTLVRELEAVYQLTAAIKAAGVKAGNNADIFRVTITGLVGITDDAQKEEAIADIKTAVEALTDAIKNAYGGQAVVELLSFDSESGNVEDVREVPVHNIKKRDVASDWITALKTARKGYQVTVPVSQDYPAIFAIFLGLVVILVVALIYIVVGMASIDPEKDSIIYRMTTTRMKKD
uniref:Renin receptor-like C-terminal transmembrane spanning segment domain-containing protein n=1 Tax=Caenorhabditis japonica TaxID=281687 RepID=A0A8R1DP02_CAEJA